MQLVAGCCVILAAKFEEPETAVPKIDVVRACTGNVFSVSLFKVCIITIIPSDRLARRHRMPSNSYVRRLSLNSLN